MIYLDNAATTKVYNEVIHLLDFYAGEMFYNPSALYGGAVQVNRDIARAREGIAEILGAKPSEIVFTGCGSEADTMAVFGSVKNKDKQIVTCVAEHAAVYNCFKELKNRGYNVRYIGTDACGRVDLNELSEALTPDTQFVSFMHVNNETGAINDIRRISALVRSVAPKCIVHSDGIQAYCKRSCVVGDLGVDLYSFSGHKIHCVKGIGGLYVRSGVHIPPLIYGGGQERGMRSGTENVCAIMALGEASRIAYEAMKRNDTHYLQLKTLFLNTLQSTVSDIIVNSPLELTANNIVNVSIRGIKAEVLLHTLEGDGIQIGLGSACSARFKTSRITDALGIPAAFLEGTIRVSFSHENTGEEIIFAAQKIAEHTEKLRKTMRSSY